MPSLASCCARSRASCRAFVKARKNCAMRTRTCRISAGRWRGRTSGRAERACSIRPPPPSRRIAMDGAGGRNRADCLSSWLLSWRKAARALPVLGWGGSADCRAPAAHRRQDDPAMMSGPDAGSWVSAACCADLSSVWRSRAAPPCHGLPPPSMPWRRIHRHLPQRAPIRPCPATRGPRA